MTNLPGKLLLALAGALLVLVGAAAGVLGSKGLARRGVGDQAKAVQTANGSPADWAVTPGSRPGGSGAGKEEAMAFAQPVGPPPSTPAVAPRTDAAEAPADDYRLQVGAFLDAAQAKRMADSVTAIGRTPVIVASMQPDGRVWQSVQVGAYPDETTATLAAGLLLRDDDLPATIVSSRGP